MKKILHLVLSCVYSTVLISQEIPSYIPTDGLIAWWPFSGNTNDESGNENNGTNMGAVLTTDRFGAVDSAYLFNGTDSYITVPTSATLESPSVGVSFSAWVNLAGLSLVGQPYAPIFTKSNSSANAFMYRFFVGQNGIGFYGGINDWYTSALCDFDFEYDQWYHIATVLDADTAYFYMNNELVSQQQFTTSIIQNSMPLEIGTDRPGLLEVFNGKIDDLAIWNRALTHEEVTGLYNAEVVSIAKVVSEILAAHNFLFATRATTPHTLIAITPASAKW